MSYLHVLDGRLRIHVAGLRNSSARAAEIEELLTGASGVMKVRANPATGNVFVLFDGRQTHHTKLVRQLARRGYVKQPKQSKQKVMTRVAESLLQSAVEVALERLIFALV